MCRYTLYISALFSHPFRYICTYIPTYIHTYRHIYIHAIIHTQTPSLSLSLSLLLTHTNVHVIYEYLCLEMTNTNVDKSIKFFIESVGRLEVLQGTFKNITFSKERGPLLETVCKILTSDIFVSTGSSLAIVLAFLPEASPILFEEVKKELPGLILCSTCVLIDQRVTFEAYKHSSLSSCSIFRRETTQICRWKK